MTPKEVRARVAQIAQMADDPERAHAAQDQLFYDVLVAVSVRTPDSDCLASEALVASDIDFARWSA